MLATPGLQIQLRGVGVPIAFNYRCPSLCFHFPFGPLDTTCRASKSLGEGTHPLGASRRRPPGRNRPN